jgi:hypothetical protein
MVYYDTRTSQKYKENSTIFYRRKRKIEIGKGKKIAWGFELQGSPWLSQ